MRHVLLALLITTACGGKKRGTQQAPADQPSAGQQNDCPATLNCMPGPGQSDPCPPEGFTKRCPHTEITE